jgi:signal-transduction protein with cAMP-binding, CBS, and nucleotidyltransferase domain
VKIIALYPVNVLVREIMSKPMITIFSNGSLKAALQTMQSKNIRRLPVVQKGDGRLPGIITDKDIFRAIMNNQQLINSLSMNNELFKENKTMLGQFSENMLKDMFHIQKIQSCKCLFIYYFFLKPINILWLPISY